MTNARSPWAGNIRHGVFFLAVAAVFGLQGFAVHDGGQWSLSPALFPLILSGGLALLSFALIGQAVLRIRAGDEGPSRNGGAPVSAVRASLAFLLCLLYAQALPRAGFLPASAVFLALFCLLVGERRPGAVAALSLVSPAVIYLLFRHGLNVLLP
ncbi:tripartite tricarboxylate transporter TctB family protein [Aminivibrio sp.]|jgi:putative tricarboxylic transport membrane protein|uniref:tripartite tricarboxylate transporter TctB family protein n=1 Tax=Aminivibrio sp. TaxID=1872489 RepID=UPI001A4A8F05|nr:tripartite tricarboxylate transporter TctB family protein [Aminivibrio sp.]MBL3540206.1 tripartite tricarboxylate transporter TctB family protein [Aminivibrio sp.]MDK2958715.1 putative tricarboxylic transport rane protein [Synergistaceae bacterium]